MNTKPHFRLGTKWTGFGIVLAASFLLAAASSATADTPFKFSYSFTADNVVTDVLPNGNMMISGSQEFGINTEMRVLNVGGIVRPRDISRTNTISYEKIAEARVSYGGRGNLSDVQQPGWGHRIYDAVAPF